jgi:hypothetical protein
MTYKAPDNLIPAGVLLKQLGMGYESKNGPGGVLSALDKIGVKPAEQRPHGKGVAFFVLKEDAENALKNTKANRMNNDELEQLQNDVKAIKKALFHMGQSLGLPFCRCLNLRGAEGCSVCHAPPAPAHAKSKT